MREMKRNCLLGHVVLFLSTTQLLSEIRIISPLISLRSQENIIQHKLVNNMSDIIARFNLGVEIFVNSPRNVRNVIVVGQIFRKVYTVAKYVTVVTLLGYSDDWFLLD